MATNFSLTALTGINSASTGLGVISNNISNAQTIGFKSSRAEFADLFYGAQNSPGTGSRTQALTQNFSQGAVNDTGNQLDLAISGNGFFILEDVSDRYEAVYTRNGSFKLDKDGFITDQMGNKLQGFNKDVVLSTPATNIYQTVLSPLNIGELNKVPKETSQVSFDMNLDGQDPVTYTTTSTGVKQSASGTLFDINTLKNQEYDGAPNYSTSKVIYDSLGGQHRMTVNYYKVAVNPPGVYDTANAAAGKKITYTNETTDWYAQYIMEDYDPVTNTYFKSGSGQDAATNGANNTTAYTLAEGKISTFGAPTSPTT
ncbi:MAG: flagellar hook-basal body complex protein, partial [Gammaproteobacteria bacterium]|nr:flagellar hook-basal body complex protein [Gammaproteobacteria bacterium]